MKTYQLLYRKLLVVNALLLLIVSKSPAQNRISDSQTIGWYTYNGDHKLNDRWAIHTEYQWRRIDVIRSWQQSLARVGVVRTLNEKMKLGGGYTYFVTFPFGRYPQAENGVPYPEHRLHEEFQLTEKYGSLELSHRFRLEQRWLADQSEERNPRRITGWNFQNRVRYQVAGEIPLKGATVDDGEWYLNFFDEVFIGFGRKVGQNIFNQNRLSGGVGYRVSEGFKLELNYLNQVLQHAEVEPISGKPVFEINNGFRLNVVYELDFTN